MVKSFKKILRKIPYKMAGSLLITAVLIIGWFFVFKNNKPTIIPSTSPATTKPSPKAATTPTPSDSSSGQSSTTQPTTPDKALASTTPATSGAAPLAPSGNFVSNHKPGGSTPTTETSVCNTSAGAECYIKFTKGSITKQLDSTTTNAAGAAFWHWDVNSAGLSQGSWTITAVATLNGQTKTTTDSLFLEIQ